MTYTSRIKPSHLKALQPIIREKENLMEGESLSITNTPVAIDKIRSLLYNYLAMTDQRGLFRITRESSTILVITRKETFTPTVDLIGQLAKFTAPASKRKPAVMKQAPAPGGKPPRVHATGPGMEFVRDHLLMEENEAAAVQALSEQGLSPEDQAVGLSEWKRINNKE